MSTEQSNNSPPQQHQNPQEDNRECTLRTAADGHRRCNCMDGALMEFPPGYRFQPFDEELLLYYLKRKVNGETIPFQEFMSRKIRDVELYSCSPEDLVVNNKLAYGEKDWYFFTPRDKKYPNGSRPNRAAGDGYWKATGADKKIYAEGNVVGSRKALVYYKGKPPKGEKTNWIMHEFTVAASNKSKVKNIISNNSMRLNQWVLCKIYKKADKVQREEEQQAQQLPTENQERTNNASASTNFAPQPQPLPGFNNNMLEYHHPPILTVPNTLIDPYPEYNPLYADYGFGIDNNIFQSMHSLDFMPDTHLQDDYSKMAPIYSFPSGNQ